jgi:hypothetical protein
MAGAALLTPFGRPPPPRGPKPSPKAEARPTGRAVSKERYSPSYAGTRAPRGCLVSPDRALCLPTFSHFLIVKKKVALSHTLSLFPVNLTDHHSLLVSDALSLLHLDGDFLLLRRRSSNCSCF